MDKTEPFVDLAKEWARRNGCELVWLSSYDAVREQTDYDFYFTDHYTGGTYYVFATDDLDRTGPAFERRLNELHKRFWNSAAHPDHFLSVGTYNLRGPRGED